MNAEIKAIYYDAKGRECESMQNAIFAEFTACVPAEMKQETFRRISRIAAELIADYETACSDGTEVRYNPQTGMYNIGCVVVK